MKPKPQRGQRVDAFAVLVEAGREADAVGEGQAHDRDGRVRQGARVGQQGAGDFQAGNGNSVRGLGIEREDEGLDEAVGQHDRHSTG